MTAAEAAAIKDWKKCEFTQIHEYYKECSEVKKQMSKEEKAAIKAENEKILEEYGWAIVDGHRCVCVCECMCVYVIYMYLQYKPALPQGSVVFC